MQVCSKKAVLLLYCVPVKVSVLLLLLLCACVCCPVVVWSLTPADCLSKLLLQSTQVKVWLWQERKWPESLGCGRVVKEQHKQRQAKGTVSVLLWLAPQGGWAQHCCCRQHSTHTFLMVSPQSSQ